MLDKMESAVKDRLTSEIRYWDFRANELREKESMGKRNAKLNADKAASRAEELTLRLQKRLSEIAMERKVSAMPPVVVGGAVVVPRGWLNQNTDDNSDTNGNNRSEIERIAMETVAGIERNLGYEPKDVSMEKCGYDIESFVPETLRESENCLRFIEVKGRAKGATTVTVSKNEMLYGLNSPDEFILAIVEVDGQQTQTVYLKEPFKGLEKPSFMEVNRSFNIAELIRNGQIVYQK